MHQYYQTLQSIVEWQLSNQTSEVQNISTVKELETHSSILLKIQNIYSLMIKFKR